jgi:hypothetical protein
MPFVKLDTGILNSTLWFERTHREVFITALLMAEPFEAIEPIEQIEVRSLDLTGFVVPPGWYGFVPAAGVGIARRALVDTAEGLDALEVLGSPDHESRTSEFEGRRLVRVDGGYLVLNYMKYRDRDYSAAERMRKLRARNKTLVTPNSDDVHPNVTQAESREQKAEAEVLKTIVEVSDSDDAPSGRSSLFGKDADSVKSGKAARAADPLDTLVRDGFTYFLAKTGKTPAQYELTRERLVMGRRGFEELVRYGKRCGHDDPISVAPEAFRLAVDRLAESPFHLGKNDSGRTYLDWHQLFRSKEFPMPKKLVEFWLDDSRWESLERSA